MTQITTALIKELREATGAGMMDCKKALTENEANVEDAKDWLRKKGLAAAAKKSGRIASEGLVAIAQEDSSKAAIIELNSETDFLAKGEKFQEFVKKISGYALEVDGNLEALQNFICTECDKTVGDAITEAIGNFGENMTLRRAGGLSVDEGVVATYTHNAVSGNLGKIGVLVGLESSGDKEKLSALGKQIAMHIAAIKPESLDIEGVCPDALAREKAIFSDQARASGKPENIIEKMVEGRIRKYYEQIVLLEQTFVIDGKTKISEVLEAAAKDIGAPVKISGYVQFTLGDGIEKEEVDFAEEVAAAVAG